MLLCSLEPEETGQAGSVFVGDELICQPESFDLQSEP